MQMWPGHMDDFEGAMEASRMANMLQHVPLAMSLCRVDYANHLKMQSSLSNHMYAPSAFEGYVGRNLVAKLLRTALAQSQTYRLCSSEFPSVRISKQF